MRDARPLFVAILAILAGSLRFLHRGNASKSRVSSFFSRVVGTIDSVLDPRREPYRVLLQVRLPKWFASHAEVSRATLPKHPVIHHQTTQAPRLPNRHIASSALCIAFSSPKTDRHQSRR